MKIHDHHDDHDDHGGLHRDLLQTGRSMDRRNVLRLAARFGMGFGALHLLGCGSDAAASIVTGVDEPTGTGGACPTKVPSETAGPFPGDSSNGPNVLNQ